VYIQLRLEALSAERIPRLSLSLSLSPAIRISRRDLRRFAFQPISCYRAMHFSTKRGLAIACRLSVRL